MVATEAFAELSRGAGASFGLPEARLVSVSHPVGGITEEELQQRASQAARQILALWGVQRGAGSAE